MSERQFKITLEFTINVSDITPDSTKKDLSHYSNYEELVKDPESFAFAERQKRILDALFKNEDLLRRYVKKRFVDQMEISRADEIHGVLRDELGVDDEEEEKMLAPIFAELNQEDAEWIQQAIDNGVFPENTEHFFSRFETNLTKVTTTDL